MFYHGTSDNLPITEYLLPAIETGYLREDWRKKLTDKVFFTPYLGVAERFAVKASKRYGGNPLVYAVRPIGDIWKIKDEEYVADKAVILSSMPMTK